MKTIFTFKFKHKKPIWQELLENKDEEIKHYQELAKCRKERCNWYQEMLTKQSDYIKELENKLIEIYKYEYGITSDEELSGIIKEIKEGDK